MEFFNYIFDSLGVVEWFIPEFILLFLIGQSSNSGRNIFNKDIGGWDTSSATDMSRMFFRNVAFNQDLSSWNVSNVTNMTDMFSGGYAAMGYPNVFNNGGASGIGNWDTSSVTNMTRMFSNNHSFDQDISGWDFSGLTNTSRLHSFMSNSASHGLSTSNYDALLVRWGSQASSMPSNMSYINMGSSTYTSGSAAATARNTLVNTYGWSITDGGAV